MPENFSNLIFIAVALAIFIGRTVRQAKKKKEEPPAPPPPRPKVQALHFEVDDDDDEDDIPGYLKKEKAPLPVKAPVKPVPPKPVPRKQHPALAAKLDRAAKKLAVRPVPVDLPPPAIAVVRPMPVIARQEEFRLDLNHLSPLKQAVVMAEVLGPPKGMT